jgi:hypothetical protein
MRTDTQMEGFIAATKEMFPGFDVQSHLGVSAIHVHLIASIDIPHFKAVSGLAWVEEVATKFNSCILDSNAHKVATQVLNDEIVKLRAENEEMKKKMANFEHYQSVVNAITEQACREIKEQLFSGK